jgi:uncharacterized protein (TIGR00288 family)
MASSNENVSMALFCDFENVALGVRDANYDKFDIKPVLERLLLKGSIVVKKAYCDWDRYKSFKASMHEANFELIEIPHVRQSGKNSADIRMVVDALDLCYTKSHVDTFVIISGDSDFSPLVSKLRENNKKVIGVGVKQSTSDLLVANCDEFIFYDDLVRESRRAKRESSGATDSKPQVKRTPEEERARRDEMEKRRSQAVEIAVNTFEALVLERGDSGKIWASVLKEAIKRRKPDFSESYYGFRTFGNLIEECKARGYLEFGRDEKSGAYVYRGNGVPQAAGEAQANTEGASQAASVEDGQQESRRSRNRGRTAAERFAERQAQRQGQPRNQQPHPEDAAEVAEPVEVVAAPVVLEAAIDLPVDAATPAKKKNGAKPPARKLKNAAKKGGASADSDTASVIPQQAAPAAMPEPVQVPAPVPAPVAVEDVPAPRPAGKQNGGRQNAGKPNAGKPNAAKPNGGRGNGGKQNTAKPPVAQPHVDAPQAVVAAPVEAAPQVATDKPVKAKPKAKLAAAAAAGTAKPARKAAAPRAPRPPKAAAPSEE